MPDLWTAINAAFTRFTPDECRNCIAATRYEDDLAVLHRWEQLQSNRVSLLRESAAHVVSTAARLHCPDASRWLRAEGDHRLAPHSTAQHEPTCRVQPDEAAAVLTQIDPQHRDRQHIALAAVIAFWCRSSKTLAT